jgi:peptidoglycan/LPS O-acetylase OafA/YrhL
MSAGRMSDRQATLHAWAHEPNLDFLRTFAVLCVVARHLLGYFAVAPRAWLQPQALGIFGVLIFFVHTSLVLMLSLDRLDSRDRVGRGRLYVSFVVRRIFRIYPLSMATVLILYFVVLPRVGDGASAAAAGLGVAEGPGQLVANLLLVQDLSGARLVLAPLWSLPAEVQMYLVLPALYFLVKARGARGVLLLAWPVAVGLALVVKKLGLPIAGGLYAPCFVAGVLGFGLLGDRRPLPFLGLPMFLALALVAYMFAYGRVGLQAGLAIPTTLALAILLPRFVRMKSLALRRASANVAKYSYGIYLFHSPCIWLAYVKLGFLGVVGSTLALVGLIAVAAVASFHLLEDPLIRVGHRLAARLTATSGA